jgi:putative spermidine/putrescine transport system permease protein
MARPAEHPELFHAAATTERVVFGGIAGVVYAFLILPTVIVVVMSFGNKYELEFPPRSFSLYLYEQFFASADWLRALERSFRIAVATAAVSMLLGVPAAYGLERGRFAGRNLLFMLVLSPVILPSIVLALGLYLYFSRLRVLGNDFSVLLGHTVIASPFVVVVTLSGLRDVDENLERAAAIMGAGPLYSFCHVTLPLLRPALLAGTLFAFLTSFDEVVIAYFLSGNAAMTLPVKMFSSIHWEISPVLAAVSTLLTVMSMAVCLIVAVWERRAKR